MDMEGALKTLSVNFSLSCVMEMVWIDPKQQTHAKWEKSSQLYWNNSNYYFNFKSTLKHIKKHIASNFAASSSDVKLMRT